TTHGPPPGVARSPRTAPSMSAPPAAAPAWTTPRPSALAVTAPATTTTAIHAAAAGAAARTSSATTATGKGTETATPDTPAVGRPWSWSTTSSATRAAPLTTATERSSSLRASTWGRATTENRSPSPPAWWIDCRGPSSQPNTSSEGRWAHDRPGNHPETRRDRDSHPGPRPSQKTARRAGDRAGEDRARPALRARTVDQINRCPADSGANADHPGRSAEVGGKSEKRAVRVRP